MLSRERAAMGVIAADDGVFAAGNVGAPDDDIAVFLCILIKSLGAPALTDYDDPVGAFDRQRVGEGALPPRRRPRQQEIVAALGEGVADRGDDLAEKRIGKVLAVGFRDRDDDFDRPRFLGSEAARPAVDPLAAFVDQPPDPDLGFFGDAIAAGDRTRHRRFGDAGEFGDFRHGARPSGAQRFSLPRIPFHLALSSTAPPYPGSRRDFASSRAGSP